MKSRFDMKNSKQKLQQQSNTTMKPGLQAAIWNKLIAKKILWRITAATVTNKFHKISMMQPAQHLNLNQEFFISLVSSARELLDGNSCPITQYTLENTTKPTFPDYAGRLKIICSLFELLIRKEPCTGEMRKRPFYRNCICSPWLYCKVKLRWMSKNITIISHQNWSLKKESNSIWSN